MAKIPDSNELKKYVQMLNDLDIIEEEINPDQDFDDLVHSFNLGIMRVGDMNKDDLLPQEMIYFQNQCIRYENEVEKGSDNIIEEKGDTKNMANKFDRDSMEDKLEAMDFDDLEEFVSDNEIKIDDMDEDDFSDKQDDWIEEILDTLEKREEGGSSDSDDGLKAKIEAMDFKELKSFIKEDSELSEALGLLKKADYKDSKKLKDIISKILEIKEGGSSESKDKTEEGIRVKLFKMDKKEVKAFLKDKNIDIEIKSKDWKDPAKKDKLILQIADIIEGSSSESKNKPLSEKDTKKLLKKMSYDEMLAFAKEKEISENDFDPDDYDEEDFSEQKAEMIKEILEGLKDTFLEGTSSKKDDSKKETKKPSKSFNERKVGETYQELAALVLKEAGKPMTKAEIVEGVMASKKKVSDKANEKSASNFTAVAMQVGIAFDVVEFDEKTEKYSYKK